MSSNPKPVILIPSYNAGSILRSVVQGALEQYPHVWLLIDGSTDDSFQDLSGWGQKYPYFKLIHFHENKGKGATMLKGATIAFEEGYTHVISMDSDGQHPATYIPHLIQKIQADPKTLVMGKPIFDETVPAIRLNGRKLTIGMTHFETGFYGLGDTLYGFRAYPVEPFLKAFSQTIFARGYDFDPEIAVRMFWLGIRPVQLKIPVKYLDKSEGGVSHFHYFRDNVKLTFLHFRLVPEYLFFRCWSIRKWIRNHHAQQKEVSA